MSRHIRLMVVDDEPIVGDRLKRVFNNAGYQVEVFSDSRDAVEKLQEQEFDIIITDFKMDGYNGLQILDIAKGIYPDIKVIIITGYIQLSTASDALSKGAYEFVTKPFKVDKLKEIVKKAELEINDRNIDSER